MRLFKKREDQNDKLLKNIERYEQEKKAEQQKSKILDKSQLKEKPIKKKVLYTTVKGCKIYGVWYE